MLVSNDPGDIINKGAVTPIAVTEDALQVCIRDLGAQEEDEETVAGESIAKAELVAVEWGCRYTTR